MTNSNEKQLLDLIKQSNSTDLQTLLTVKENAKRNVLDDPSAANIAAFERASKALDVFTGDPGEEDPLFENRIEVLKHLQAEGYKIKKTKLYQDAKDGLLKMQADGKVKLSDIGRYIRRIRLEKLPELSAAAGDDDLSSEKARKEIEKLSEQIQDLRFKRETSQGRWVLKDEFDMELAARAAVFEAGLRHMIDSQVGEWIQAVSGDTAKSTGLREMVHERLDDMLNEFASTDYFHVMIVGEEEKGEDEYPNGNL